MTPDALIETLTQPWAHGAHASLPGGVFDAPVVLDGLSLRSFDLSGAAFNGGLSARGARFLGMAWFQGAQIAGPFDLTGAMCHSDLRLDGVSGTDLILNDARLDGVLTLDRACLGTLSARACLCLANLSLAGTRVTGMTDLTDAQIMGGVWADGAALGDLTVHGAEIEGRQHGL